MANLKIVNEIITKMTIYNNINEEYIRSRVLNVDTNRYVKNIGTYTTKILPYEGLRIVKVNGKCKAILEWKREFYGPNEKIYEVRVYNTNGKKIFKARRGFKEYGYYEFKITFGENTVTCITMRLIDGNKDYIINKNVYNYDGEKLLRKQKTMTKEKILEKLSTDEDELSNVIK